MTCFVLVFTMWKMVNHLCGSAWMILLWGNVKDWLCSQWVSGYFISNLQLSQTEVKLVSSFASRFVLVVIWFLCMEIWMDLHIALSCMYLNVTHNKVKYIGWLGVHVVTISTFVLKNWTAIEFKYYQICFFSQLQPGRTCSREGRKEKP